jgi:hypothetical protein
MWDVMEKLVGRIVRERGRKMLAFEEKIEDVHACIGVGMKAFE